MHRLLADLGDPQRAWPAAHIAGTKGKGSTTALLAAVLAAAGYRVGAYSRCVGVRGCSWCIVVGSTLASGAVSWQLVYTNRPAALTCTQPPRPAQPPHPGAERAYLHQRPAHPGG